jgi:HlyD family secretion protein
MPPLRSLRLWISLAGAGLLAAAGAFLATRNRGEPAFTAAAAARQDLRDTVTANGEIQARTRVNIGTSVTGRIVRLHVADGQWVKAGDLLVTLEQGSFRQALNQAQQGLAMLVKEREKAEAVWRSGETTWARRDYLFAEGLLSREDHQLAALERDKQLAERERSRAAVDQARAVVAEKQDALDRTVLRAPMDGRVTGLQAEQGETAVAGQTNVAGAVLMVISRLDEMVAEVKVNELDVGKLRPGQAAEVQVDALPGKVFPGQVLEVATGVDVRSGQGGDPMAQVQNFKVKVRIQAPDQDREALRPGMGARVAVLVARRAGALSVPLQAIQDREVQPGELGLMSGTQPVAFVVRGGVAEERALRLGLVTRQGAEVLEGLREGEQVVTGPVKAMATLAAGARVRLVPAGRP